MNTHLLFVALFISTGISIDTLVGGMNSFLLGLLFIHTYYTHAALVPNRSIQP